MKRLFLVLMILASVVFISCDKEVKVDVIEELTVDNMDILGCRRYAGEKEILYSVTETLYSKTFRKATYAHRGDYSSLISETETEYPIVEDIIRVKDQIVSVKINGVKYTLKR